MNRIEASEELKAWMDETLMPVIEQACMRMAVEGVGLFEAGSSVMKLMLMCAPVTGA